MRIRAEQSIRRRSHRTPLGRVARAGLVALMGGGSGVLAAAASPPPAGAIAPPNISVGNAPLATAIDPVTHTVYVTNLADNTVSVIDGAHCGSLAVTACTAAVATAPVGTGPLGLVFDAANHTLYVANLGQNFEVDVPLFAGSISLIDTSTCNATNTAGCAAAHPQIATGTTPLLAALDATTNTVYVTNFYAVDAYGDPVNSTVSIVNGATCNATTPASCPATLPTTTVGKFPVGLDVDTAHHTLYVANEDVFSGSSGTVSVVDTANCNGTNTSGCGATWPTVTTPEDSEGVAVDPLNHTVYVTGSDGLAMIDNNLCNAASPVGCATPPLTSLVPAFGVPTVDLTTGVVYVTGVSPLSGSPLAYALFAIDGGHCNSADLSACDPTAMPPTIPPSVPLTTEAIFAGLDPTTGTLYVPAYFGFDPMSGFNFGNTVTVLFRPSFIGTPPAGTTNSPYTFSFAASGAPDPTFSVTAGTLPPGLTLSPTGAISGTPTTAGSYPVTVTATNFVAPAASQSLTITVNPAVASGVSIADTSVTEGNSASTYKLAKFTITRSGDLSGAASVEFYTQSGTASPRAIQDTDFKKEDTIVHFAPGVATMQVTVKIIGDTINESNEKFRGVLDNPSTGLTITRNVALCTIVDDD